MLQNEGSSIKIGQKLTELHANAQLEKIYCSRSLAQQYTYKQGHLINFGDKKRTTHALHNCVRSYHFNVL